MKTLDPSKFIGEAPERLSLRDGIALAGKWIALEIYTPQTLPLRRIEALGDTVEACVEQLQARRLNPENFEIVRLARPIPI